MCRQYKAGPAASALVALLEDPVRDVKVFDVTGIDLAGPLFLLTGDKVVIKPEKLFYEKKINFPKIIDKFASQNARKDEFSIFPQSYSMDIHGYVLVYSITSERSFEIVKSIHHRLLDMTGKVQVPIVLVGNKVDLHMERTVSYEDGKRAAASMNAEFLEASAKHNESVTDIFKRIILEIEKANGNVQEKSNCVVS
ncbi:GTP-binding protein Rheb [Trichonephila clavipes]|nr:GTP-binding protein Rheb [Trichonephila clavipes]